MAASAAKGVSTARPYQGVDPRDAAALRTKLAEALQLWRDDVLSAAVSTPWAGGVNRSAASSRWRRYTITRTTYLSSGAAERDRCCSGQR